jgi:hypothetical protein
MVVDNMLLIIIADMLLIITVITVTVIIVITIIIHFANSQYSIVYTQHSNHTVHHIH